MVVLCYTIITNLIRISPRGKKGEKTIEQSQDNEHRHRDSSTREINKITKSSTSQYKLLLSIMNYDDDCDLWS